MRRRVARASAISQLHRRRGKRWQKVAEGGRRWQKVHRRGRRWQKVHRRGRRPHAATSAPSTQQRASPSVLKRNSRGACDQARVRARASASGSGLHCERDADERPRSRHQSRTQSPAAPQPCLLAGRSASGEGAASLANLRGRARHARRALCRAPRHCGPA